MKRRLISTVLASVFTLYCLAGCGRQQAMSLVNTAVFDAADLQSISLDYDADNITVLEGAENEIVLKEYMNGDKKGYYARTSLKSGELLITEGDRPKFSDFQSYIEICIPLSYTGSLSLHTTSGTINSEIALSLTGAFDADTTNGIIELEDIEADEINVQTTNAAASMNQITGTINYQSTGGELKASALHGSGSFNASGDGSMDISFDDVTGDIAAYSKNGDLMIKLPNKLEFDFSAVTKEGSITTSFDDGLSVTDNTAAGLVGNLPTASILLETRNGNIEVSRE